MVKDSFTGYDIPRGTGIMFVKKDGTIYYFASKKTEKSFLELNRKAKKLKWTGVYQKGTGKEEKKTKK